MYKMTCDYKINLYNSITNGIVLLIILRLKLLMIQRKQLHLNYCLYERERERERERELFQNHNIKILGEAKWIPLTHKCMTAHCPGLAQTLQ
jgi:hypothetical protein